VYDVTMTRVQVMMESDMHQQIKNLAKRRNISTSKLIRQTLKTQLVKSKNSTTDVLLKAASKAKGGMPADLSTNDYYIYGQ